MKVWDVVTAAAVVGLLLSPIEARALEFVGWSSPAAQIGDGVIRTVQHRRVAHPQVNRNVHVNRQVHGYRPGYRPVVAAPRGVWVGRPGWYRWAPGGAIAAGAAIGFATAASAAAWAGAPPQPGLCWYYTDPSRSQGFWDACP